jgi:hypothetical protein
MASHQLPRLSHPSTRQRRPSLRPDFPRSRTPPLPDSSPLILLIPRWKTWPKQVQVLKVSPIISPLPARDIESYCARRFVIVALHRFVDYVPLVVDTELVRSVCEDLAPALRQSFKFSEPNLVERCRELLQEPPEVKKEREFLEQKLRRLSRAEEEVRNFWVNEFTSRDD